MLEAANAVVTRITPAQAKEMIGKGDTLVLDVRKRRCSSNIGALSEKCGAVHT
jgi:hypothetical protein